MCVCVFASVCKCDIFSGDLAKVTQRLANKAQAKEKKLFIHCAKAERTYVMRQGNFIK